MNYTLKDKTPVPTDNIIEWARWFEKANRHVAITHLDDGVHVSTVFLGIDHAFFDGPPVLFETMIFGGKHDGYQDRYCTWEEAERGHEEAIKLIQQS